MENKEHIIGCFYDCDQTLIPGCMQQVLFSEYHIDEESFWKELNFWADQIRDQGGAMDLENGYLNFLLKYQEEGKIPPLSNELLRQLGVKIQTYPGLPEFFSRTKNLIETHQPYQSLDIKVEHYIVSTGLKELIKGSPLYLDGIIKDVFAAEFVEENGQIKYVGRGVGHMKKTEFLHLANKGSNINPNIDVNHRTPQNERRIPFEQMIYVGDGFTDVPCFALVMRRGGYTLGVYDPEIEKAQQQAQELLHDRRVASVHPADYRPGSSFSQAFEAALRSISERIIYQNEDRR